ncbi:2OG-Fe(II) oxygenase [Paucibacter sp. B2R-40]|uniref:2OG-Fe(II) oxygenase n=1 Tax=Paucibacter sp. B2R-40 TaxID=2893554 RepID=UPI0021E3640B|nr:2OG-Fe(II) oxygenase [Paucibacter sp. B2R-40]MCV2356105.1 2OG-Fe(II) oxygenase [Paucibacter sp. B2R-40]
MDHGQLQVKTADRLLNFGGAEFRYDPYPIGFARDVVPDALYKELVESFPTIQNLRRTENLGNKYLLTEFDGEPYLNLVRASPSWQRFYAYIKGTVFIEQMIETLRAAKMDLGLQSIPIANANELADPLEYYSSKVARKAKHLLRLARQQSGHLTSRFEFSALPGNGGSHYPHTDTPRKVISLVLSMMKEGEWDPDWGGGTTVCRPKDMTDNFNYLNRYLGFNDVEVIETFPFVPNACVIFIKTFNSWHAVMPYEATDERAVRKSITINIDYTGGRI